MKKAIVIFLIIYLFACSAGCTVTIQDIHKPVSFYYLQSKVAYDNPDGLIVALIAESEGNKDDYEYLIRKYLEGPSDTKLKSPFPEGTQLLEVNCETNRIQIVLSAHMAELDGISMTVAFACLTKTLAEMTGTQTVQIQIADYLINGQESVTLSPNNFSYWDSVTAGNISP